MTFSREERYRTLESATGEEIDCLKDRVAQSIWRQLYHIQPKHGLLNDPNGFSWFNGKYHLFYQWHPLEATHGLKYWYHLTSLDLVNWQDEGIGIAPELDFESHGIFSGTGFVENDKLYLFYTGNKRDDNWERHSSQALAYMTKNGEIQKLNKPIIPEPPAGFTHDFRDPKIVTHKDCYYMFIGGQSQAKQGCILVYQGTSLLEWQFIGPMKTNHTDFGFMWECPDFFTIDEQDILLISPQGLAKKKHLFNNIYNSGVFIGKYNYETNYFDTKEFQELDSGFDFYAPQTTTAPDGRQILIGWMGLPDTSYPNDKDGWSGCLTIPRELFIKHNKIYQQPIKELESLRNDKYEINTTLINAVYQLQEFKSQTIEIRLDMQLEEGATSGIRFKVGEGEFTTLYLNSSKKELVLDREKTGVPVAVDFGTKRKIPYDKEQIKLRLYLDTSSVEIFVNEGEAVFTSRLFATNTEQKMELFSEEGKADFDLTAWTLK